MHSGTPRLSHFSRNVEFARPSLPLFVILSLGLLLNLAIRPAPATAQGLMGQGSGDEWSTTPPTVNDWWFLAFVLGALALLISLTLLVVWFIKFRPYNHRPLPCPIPGEVVHQAAAILEQEIAAGIVAAQQVEERLAASKVFTAGDSITRIQDEDNQPFISIRRVAQDQRVFHFGNGSVPTVTIPNAIKPGEEVAFTLDLENNLEEPTGEFAFVSSSLVSASGEQIPAKELGFEPEVVDIGPHKAHEVTLTVHVPLGKPDGTYVGLIQTTKPGQFRAVLAIRIAQEG